MTPDPIHVEATADPVPAIDTFNLDAIEWFAGHVKQHSDMLATNLTILPRWRTLSEAELAKAKASLLRTLKLIEEAETRFKRDAE